MSEVKTNLVGSIVLPARTNSEGYTCDGYVLHLNKEQASDLLTLMNLAQHSKNTAQELGVYEFMSVNYFGGTGAWVNMDDSFTWPDEDNPVFITDQMKRRQIDCRVDTGIMKVGTDEVVFTALGKYSGDEFWTSPLTREFLNTLLIK